MNLDAKKNNDNKQKRVNFDKLTMRIRLKLSSEFWAKEEGEEKYFCKRLLFTCQPISRVHWNNDQHQSKGKNTDEKEFFMTVTELKLTTGLDQ